MDFGDLVRQATPSFARAGRTAWRPSRPVQIQWANQRPQPPAPSSNFASGVAQFAGGNAAIQPSFQTAAQPKRSFFSSVGPFVKNTAVNIGRQAAQTGAGVVNLERAGINKIFGGGYTPVQKDIGGRVGSFIGSPSRGQYISSALQTGALGLGPAVGAGRSLLGRMVASGATNAALGAGLSAASQKLETGKINPRQVGIQAAGAGVLGGVLGIPGRALPRSPAEVPKATATPVATRTLPIGQGTRRLPVGPTSAPDIPRAQRVTDAFSRSVAHEPIGNLGNSKFELGSFGKNQAARKTTMPDRFSAEELPQTINNIKGAYRASNNPASYRADNIAWVAKMPDGESRVVYTRQNARGNEEIVNWHKVNETKNPNYLSTLESFGSPDRIRTGISGLEHPQSSPLTYGADRSLPQSDKSVKPDESGFIAPGAPIKAAQDLINKHQQSVQFTGDIRRFADSSEGAKNNLLNDAAKLTKNRLQLTNEEKAQVQAYRDAKMTGQSLPKVSDRVLQADKETTDFARATIANDVERAKFEGNLQKAQTIAQRNPETYTHRVAQGKGSAFDYVLQNDRKNPLQVGLGKTTPSDKTRTMFAAVDESGDRHVISIKTQSGKSATGQKVTKPNQIIVWEGPGKGKPIGSISTKADAVGKTFQGPDGKTYKIDQASANEIEKATGQKYYQDPWLTNHAAYLDSRIALENARTFEAIKKSPESSTFMAAPGETAPKGYKSVPGLMQFQGYKFEPRVADALKDAFTRGEPDAIDKVGKVLRQSIVYFPVKHDFNMAAAYVVDRGAASLVNPMAYGRMVKSWVNAYQDIKNKTPFYQEVAKRGFGLTTNDRTAFENVFKQELQKLTPEKVTPLAQTAKLNPVRLYSAIQKLSVWDVQDFLNLARIHERMQPGLLRKGMGLDEALKQTERYSFQYKVPEKVAGSRSASQALQSNKVFFGRYRYDQYRIATNILKGAVDIRRPGEAAQNLDKLAALTVGATILWPAVNKGVQTLSGNPNAYIKAPGPLELPETAEKVRRGTQNLFTAASNQLYLGPIQQAMDLKANRDSFTGKPIADPNASVGDQAKQKLSWLKGQIAPVQRSKGLQNTTGNRAVGIGLMLSGANFPKNSPPESKLLSLKNDSLPMVQKQAKDFAAKGNTQGAINAISKYDQRVLDATKAAAKALGKQLPDDKTLIGRLKKAGYYYDPTNQTVQDWQNNANQPKVGTLDEILNTQVAPKKGESGYTQYRQQQSQKARQNKLKNQQYPNLQQPIIPINKGPGNPIGTFGSIFSPRVGESLVRGVGSLLNRAGSGIDRIQGKGGSSPLSEKNDVWNKYGDSKGNLWWENETTGERVPIRKEPNLSPLPFLR